MRILRIKVPAVTLLENADLVKYISAAATNGSINKARFVPFVEILRSPKKISSVFIFQYIDSCNCITEKNLV